MSSQPARHPLTPRQAAIVNGKLLGKSQAAIGGEIYPNQTPNAAAVSVSRQLRKANVQEELQAALERYGLTIEQAVIPIAEALVATRTVASSTTEVPDHAVRLRAADMILKLLVPQQTAANVARFEFMQHIAEERRRFGFDIQLNQS